MKVTYNYSPFPPILIRYLNIKFQTLVYYLCLCYEFPLGLKRRMPVVKIQESLYTHTHTGSDAASSTGLSSCTGYPVLGRRTVGSMASKTPEKCCPAVRVEVKNLGKSLDSPEERAGGGGGGGTPAVPLQKLPLRGPAEKVKPRKFPERRPEACGEPRVEKGNGMKGAGAAERTTASIPLAPAPLREQVEESGLKE